MNKFAVIAAAAFTLFGAADLDAQAARLRPPRTFDAFRAHANVQRNPPVVARRPVSTAGLGRRD
jgi:hypothetical protein